MARSKVETRCFLVLFDNGQQKIMATRSYNYFEKKHGKENIQELFTNKEIYDKAVEIGQGNKFLWLTHPKVKFGSKTFNEQMARLNHVERSTKYNNDNNIFRCKLYYNENEDKIVVEKLKSIKHKSKYVKQLILDDINKQC